MTTMSRTRSSQRRTVLLKDLDPAGDVRGGSGKRLFGEFTLDYDAARADRPVPDRRSGEQEVEQGLSASPQSLREREDAQRGGRAPASGRRWWTKKGVQK
jgi:hypothetical protein